MSDLENRPPAIANHLLTEPRPNRPESGPDSRPPGASVEPEGASKPSPQNAAPTAASEPERASSALPPALQAHLTGIPDSLPPTWCPNCKADVLPKGKGKCPRCGQILKNSFLARRHPVNKLRRQQILDKLIADYAPTSTMLNATCEHLSGILEQLEVLKPGSPEHQRLVQLGQTLGTALEESCAARTTSDGGPDFDKMDDAQILAHLTKQRASLDQLIDQLTPEPVGGSPEWRRKYGYEPLPDVDECLIDGHPAVIIYADDIDDEAGLPREVSAMPAGKAAVPTPVPALKCEWCHQTPCVGREHHSYDVLHSQDPEHVEARQKRRDAEMAESLRRQRQGLGPPRW